MNEQYRPDLRANIVVDDAGVVRQILHHDRRWFSEAQTPARAGLEYLREHADVLGIGRAELEFAHDRVSYRSPRAEDTAFRLAEEKQQFDATTLAYAQTHLNIPVWRKGVTVRVKGNPTRVVASTNTALQEVSAALPPEEVIDRWQRMFDSIDRRSVGEDRPADAIDRTVRNAVGLAASKEARSAAASASLARQATGIRVNRGRFYVYRYDPDERQSPRPKDVKDSELEANESLPTLPLPPVPSSIEPGGDYVVAELLFTFPVAGIPGLNWRALLEVETNAVLYLRALVSGVDGLVFTADPYTATGDLTNSPDQPNSVLNPLRTDVTLQNLSAPAAGVQSLTGTNVQIADDDAPAIAPPDEATGTDFDYNVRTDDFAAVCTYYHLDRLFETIEDLGFPLGTYFDGTAFPVRADHRASYSDPNGIERNAFCSGDAQGDGIGLVGYMLSDLTDTANPLGRAVDGYVHWHEVAGHGILWDHVESPNFGFAHSAGDGLAGIHFDPESQLRELGLVQRFQYAPFRGLDRWMNRDVASGWAWGGTNDVGGYNSEQILATCHFRLYRAVGGDSASLTRRRFASRVVTYLILRAVGELTPMSNPSTPLAWCNELMAADLEDWTSEGLSGGAYNKVIRWAFEQQGLFQPAGAPTPVTSIGAPPEVDVYIDDGRAGEYQYQAVHWNNPSIWNRQAPDGLVGHQPAIEGATNYAYVKVKNRGTTDAANVNVKGYHSLPGAGLTWPTDFTAMSPALGLNAASIAANNGSEVVLGPFEWVPNVNAYGHDCVLMIASVAGDPSNVDNFVGGDSIAEWRLVPNDNNVGQKNVQLVPGGGGMEGLLAGLADRFFMAGNTFRVPATMALDVSLPRVLVAKGWKIRFPGIPGTSFRLDPGERRRVAIEMVPGQEFTAVDIEGTTDREIRIELAANGMPIGGMTYVLDPAMKRPPERLDARRDCRDAADDLLDCLDLPGGRVRDVKVRRVSLDLCLDEECC